MKKDKRPFRGRPPVSEGETTISACLRMTRAQREKLRLLGGARWIREQIDLASVKEGET